MLVVDDGARPVVVMDVEDFHRLMTAIPGEADDASA